MGKRTNFSMTEFKEWMSQQAELSEFFNISDRKDESNSIVGSFASHKVSRKKLLERIEESDGDPKRQIADLMENGAEIVGTNGKNVILEVNSGVFQLPRFCIRLD